MSQTLDQWIKEQNRIVAKSQKKHKPFEGVTGAYYGAIGGGFSTYYKLRGEGGFVENALTKNRFYFDTGRYYGAHNLSNDLISRIDKFCADNPGTCYICSTLTSLGEIVTLYNHDQTINECLTDFSDW